MFVGQVPDRMIVGLLDSRGFNGDLEYYPFAFQKFGMIRIRQVIDSEEYPYPTLELNGANGRKDLLGYHRFLEVSGSLLNHRPSMIQPSEWGQDKNCTLFAFNNIPNGEADVPGHRNPRQGGNVRLEIDFRANPNKNLTVVVWGKFENVFQIDDKKRVFHGVHPSDGLPSRPLKSTACGHYTLLFLKERARGRTMEEFLEGFSSYDFVGNDRVVDNQVRRLLVQDLYGMPSNQSCIAHDFVVIRE